MKNGRELAVHKRGKGIPPWAKRRTAPQGMPCPLCGAGSIVCDSRPIKGSQQRRRACAGCGHRFVTREVVGLPGVVARDEVGEAVRLLREMADRLEARQRLDNEGAEATE